MGRPAISSLIISASALNPSAHIIDEELKLEPKGQEPQPLQEEIGGSPDSIRGLGFANSYPAARHMVDCGRNAVAAYGSHREVQLQRCK